MRRPVQDFLPRIIAMKLALPALVLLGLANAARADLLDDILSALESAVDCAGCNALLVPIQALAHLGNDAFVATFTSLCELVGVRCARSLWLSTKLTL